LLQTSQVERPKPHGAIRSEVVTTTRGEIGAVLSDGTVHRFSPVDLPHVPANSISFEAGVSVERYLGLDTSKGVKVVGFVTFGCDDPIGLFTRKGVVKRALLTNLPNKEVFEVISLKSGDEVTAVTVAPDNAAFVAVASD